MFNGQYVLAEVRAGNIAPKWLVIPAKRRFLLQHFMSNLFGMFLLAGLVGFAALGSLSAQLWAVTIVTIIIGIVLLWYVRGPLEHAYHDLMSWRRQYAIFTPEGFLIAQSAAAKPHISLAYRDIGEMYSFSTTLSSEGGPSISLPNLHVTYHDQSVHTFMLDNRFGPEERLWEICIAAHHWYVTHADVDEELLIE